MPDSLISLPVCEDTAKKNKTIHKEFYADVS